MASTTGDQGTTTLNCWRVVEELRRALTDAFAPSFRGLILYGSYARGDQDAGSDIDLLVLFKDKLTADASRAKMGELAAQLLSKHQALVSAVPVSERDYQLGRSPFLLNIKREGILVLPDEALEMKPEIERALEMARSSLDAAKDLFESEKGYYGFAVSRAYYAMFYAAEAALLSRGLAYSRHRGVIAGFGQHFVREGLLPGELQTALRTAFDLRNLGDYSTEPFTREMAEPVLKDAEAFIQAIEDYLRRNVER